MSSKKLNGHQEMVQLVGRSTAAATFLKSTVRQQQSAQGYRPVLSDDPKPYGAGFSHADILRAHSKSKPESAFVPRFERHISYTDLDDDWDASFDNDVMALGPRSGSPIARSPSPSPAAPVRPHSPRLDLYPTSRRNGGSTTGLKPHYDRIVKDPANSLHMIYHPAVSSSSAVGSASAAEIELVNARISRINKFKRVLQSSNVDVSALRNLAWSGIPDELRPMSWQLLLGYLPSNADRRVSTLARKRREYADGVKQAFGNGVDHAVWHQINIDVPRTNPHLTLYSFEATQRSLERILYVWAIRHPASGYVQGINDLVTPFFQVFLSAYIDADVESYDPGLLPREVLDVVEADSFWCLTKLLDGIQDNYIFAQPGIQRQVAALKDLTQRIDASLARHLQAENVEFIQFSFRWMNCLLMREVSVKNTIRMWDTYMAEGQTGFSEFHLYVCAAFLVKWSAQIQTMDFQEIMMFLQSLPTQSWTEKDVELLLSEAYMWQSLFKNATAHLRASGT
ncbi:rab-GTPase-TBC domain-containing protein [Lipomyces tetrasporus]|uniref:Rab-GTPase-TBC domain-containing protein n=1 Tax=Lipomyces tetrasporus TaxID=54092 RepID=A0AAD7VTT5_9ASCO|nr:rab-GTPase-TBC domain-containing protein [Lipomyces tetrasporus]KAJ8101798.1 rab-GTPase-TBC domain-containing protein [Lipomyces tetrasporus]